MTYASQIDEPLPTETPLEFLRRVLVETAGKNREAFLAWSRFRIALLRDFHIEADVERLVADGVAIQTLAAAMMFINLAPGFDHFLKKYFGDRRNREQKAAVLNEAIAVIREFDELFKSYRKVPPQEFLRAFRQPSPTTVISGLESYVFILRAGERFFDFLEVNSVIEVAKYALAAVVYKITGRYLDREVSALTGAALQKYDYDETTHRVWRIRNFDRLSQTKASFVLEFLEVLNSVVSASA